MENIKYVNFQHEVGMNAPEWKKAEQFECKGKIVEHNGHKYEIVSKETKDLLFPTFSLTGLIIQFAWATNIVPKQSVYFALPLPNTEAEKVIKAVWNPIDQPKHIALIANQKMWKNAQKAIKEHSGDGYVFTASTSLIQRYVIDPIKYLWYKTFGSKDSPFVHALPNLTALENAAPATPLQLSHTDAEGIGRRPTMEDAHFYKEISQGTLSGVFDGHGGQEIAKYASRAFETRFETALTDANGNVREAFEMLFAKVQEEVARCSPLHNMGSTAVVSFVDKKTNIIYTATLGDSEASIYRTIDGQMKSIPLSCVRDWSSKKDAARAAKALNQPSIAREWPKIEGKALRFPQPMWGVNVARAFGDLDAGYLAEGPGMTHKPKITMNQLQEGDVVILACDGLKDYVPEKEIVDQIAAQKDNTATNLAQHLVNYAVKDKNAGDNVSVVAIKVASSSR